MNNAMYSGLRSPYRSPRMLQRVAEAQAAFAEEKRLQGDLDASQGQPRRYQQTPCFDAYHRAYDACLAAQITTAEQLGESDELDDETADYYAELTDAASY